ncbi:MAG TPA: hypothetical protein VGF69_08415 [Thermoanaerobaculia bacterium]
MFDFPRINLTGTLTLNPATANNDDLSFNPTFVAPDGQTAALFDSADVTPLTLGMNDDDFVNWIQQVQNLNTSPPSSAQQQVPAEWNYYGDAGTSCNATVISVVNGPNQLLTSSDPAVPVSSLIGASLTYSGVICDLNPQGSPPATQFFIPQLTLANGSSPVVRGPASKGACQWINYFRNVNAVADQGAGGYLYHVVLKSECTPFNIPGFEDAIGAIFRYYIYNVIIPVGAPSDLAALYQKKQQNPATAQIVATIAPLYAGEAITTGPVGRFLVPSQPPAQPQSPPSTPSGWIKTSSPNNNGGGVIPLAPAMVSQKGNTISVEFVGTFPDNYQPSSSGPPYTNGKYDFQPVTLVVNGNGTSVPIATVDYTDTDRGNQLGWLFDYDISGNAAAQTALSDPNAAFTLDSLAWGRMLSETDYYIATNQLSIYAEQFGAGDSFVNQGSPERATVSVYRRGVELTVCPPISVWSYATVPLQTPGQRLLLTSNFQPGDSLTVDVSQAGNFNFVFTVGDQPAPPSSWSAFIAPLAWIVTTNTTSISLRILPNAVDFSQYYADPASPTPVGNAALTFAVVYQNVLRTYYLLFPAMNQYVQLNEEASVAAAAAQILTATDPANWMEPSFMPRTRDLSQSRRTLLQAWCRMQPPAPRSRPDRSHAASHL